MDNLKGKTAFVTGAASGIGFGIARACSDAGMNVVMADIEEQPLIEAAHVLTGKGANVTNVVADVMDRESMERAAVRAEEDFGDIHLLCNNAGVTVRKPLDQTSYADWDWVLGVNLGGVVNGLVTFLPRLKRHGQGAHILSTSSVGGLVGMGGIGIYAASKFAVVGLSESLRIDLQPHGIGVSVLCPGIVRTRFADTERNRPAHFKDDQTAKVADAGAKNVRDWSQNKSDHENELDHIDVGQMALAGIRANDLYICTHPEFRQMIERRGQLLAASFNGTPDPEKTSAVEAVITVPY